MLESLIDSELFGHERGAFTGAVAESGGGSSGRTEGLFFWMRSASFRLRRRCGFCLRGNIFETCIIAELIKSRLNRGERPWLWFWRDSNGNEVDIIAEEGLTLMPIEIKSGKTITGRDFRRSADMA